jgi:hypothetical protein
VPLDANSLREFVEQQKQIEWCGMRLVTGMMWHASIDWSDVSCIKLLELDLIRLFFLII